MTEISTTFTHRVPIDGLRAIAVMLVLLFHAGMPGLGNGFVGVDIFFALSGYLITTLLLRERLSKGRISFGTFYARRMRRLLPASLLVLIVTAVVYRVVAPPLDVLENRASFAFAAIYIANWYFMAHSQDYFAAQDAPSPVLHYWSLGVEEQFYLAWPLLLAGIVAVLSARRRLLVPTLALLAASALALSVVLQLRDPAGAYFNTFARIYQLLAGATLAAWMVRREPNGRADGGGPRIGTGLIAGAAVVLVAVVALGSRLGPWPVGLFGVAATVAFLAGIELAPRSRLLAPLQSWPAVRLGGWSYSMYLWHWPVIVVGALLFPVLDEWAWPVRVGVVLVVTILLSELTSRLVEKPMSRVSVSTAFRRHAAVIAGLAASAVAAVLVLGVVQAPVSAQQLVAAAQQGQVDDTTSGSATIDIAGAPDPSTAASDRATVSGKAARPSTVLMIGDSHAELWREGFLDAAKKDGFTGILITSSGCPWMDLPALSDRTGEPADCQDKLWAPALAAARKYHPDVVILISRSVLSRRLQVGNQILHSGDPGWAPLMTKGVTSSLAQIQPLAKQIAIIEPYPLTRTPMLDCLTKGSPPRSCNQTTIELPGTADVESLYHRLATQYPNVQSVSLDQIICPDGTCPAMKGGQPTFADNNHLTHAFAATLVPDLWQALADQGIVVRGTGGRPLAKVSGPAASASPSAAPSATPSAAPSASAGATASP